MFNLPSMAPSIRLQWHHQTAVILIGCAPTHLHPAFNGTINPPAMAPSLSKLQQWHHRCHPHRLCANSCSICPQWHPQSAFNGTTAVILIGCAPTHLHPAFNGTINPPAMAPLTTQQQMKLKSLRNWNPISPNPQIQPPKPPTNSPTTTLSSRAYYPRQHALAPTNQ